MIILGCNGGRSGYVPLLPTSRDSSAAILVDGQITLAIEEERLSREKHSFAFPVRAIDACLRSAGLSNIEEVDRVAYACRRMDASDVVLRRGAVLSPGASFALDAGVALARTATRTARAREAAARLAIERALRATVPSQRFTCVSHGIAHTANAFFTSPFERALCLVSTSELHARRAIATVVEDARFEPVEARFAPDSLALLSELVARFLGFAPGEESKLLALAGLGDPARFRRFFGLIVQTSVDGVAQVEPTLLSLLAGRPLFTGRGLSWRGSHGEAALVHALGRPRREGEPLEGRHQDIAAALEEAVERALLTSLEVLARRTGERHLCLAGGVAQSPTVNGIVARSGLFDRVHVAPATNDAGTAVGAALYVEHVLGAAPRRSRSAPSAFLGPVREPVSIAREAAVESHGVRASRPDGLIPIVARALASGKIVGWCEGRSEWGTSALGHRSILADPRSTETRDRLTRTVKKRATYRPYAPAVLAERADELFDLTGVASGAHMQFAVPVRAAHRAALVAVTHVDGTARVQTVSKEDAPSLHAVLRAFDGLTGVPALLNTSFNVNDEPILETPEDAIHCFLSTGIDMLVVDGVLFQKVPLVVSDAPRRRPRGRLRIVPSARPAPIRVAREDVVRSPDSGAPL